MFIRGRYIRQQQKRTTQEPIGKEMAKPEVNHTGSSIFRPPNPTVPVSVGSFVELPVHFFPCHHFIAASRSADRTPVTVKENK